MENRIFADDLQISKVNKWYPGDVHAVKDMDMEIKRGEFIVFVGPSGCGKTTLLRMIAGLESISSGEVDVYKRQPLPCVVPCKLYFTIP